MKHQKTEKPKDRRAQHLRKHRLLIASLVGVIILLIATIIWFLLQNSQQNQPKPSLGAALTVHTPDNGKTTITSQLGFSVTYDKNFLDANAQVTEAAKDGYISGQSYSGDDLKTNRSYSIVKLDTKAEVSGSGGVNLLSRPELSIVTTARKTYFDTRHATYPGLSDTEIAVREFAPPTAKLLSRDQEVVGNITYQKLLYEYLSSTNTVISYDLQYLTVQNNRPYTATISYYPSTKQGDLTILAQTLDTITYKAPDAAAQYLSQTGQEPRTIVKANQPIGLLASETVNTPKALSEGTDLSIVAKNQLAVVRVGTIYCYDATLLNIGGDAAQEVTNACAAGVGSGSIVRKDGIVSTNGHVVNLSFGDAFNTAIQIAAVRKNTTVMQKYMDYFVDNGFISQSDAASLISDLTAGKPQSLEALQTLINQIPQDRIRVNKKGGQYAIQLSDTPIKLAISGNKLSFNNDKTVVSATYIDSNFSQTGSDPFSSGASDVALLAIDSKHDYPVVKVGAIKSLKKGDALTIIGYPGFVDGGVTPTLKHTIPTATQGDVIEVGTDSSDHSLAATSAPLAEGNSGGPVFNNDGDQVGLATYAVISAADPGLGKTKLSRQSVVRDAADMVALAATHNLTLSGESPINESWYAAIDAYSKGSYDKALSSLKQTGQLYGDNYLINNLTFTAQEQVNKDTQARLKTFGFGAVIVVLVVSSAGIIVLIVRHHKRGKELAQPPMVPPFVSPPPMQP